WDVKTRQPIGQPLVGHTGGVTALAFSRDGKILASGSHDKTIILWDAQTRQPIGQPIYRHPSDITEIAFSPDGKTLAAGSSNIILWNISNVLNTSVGIPQPIGQ